MADDTDPEQQTTPPANTYTVSHIIDHRPSLLTPPTASQLSHSHHCPSAAFDYLTVWVGYEGEDTWEPRSSFWDEWKVSEYWKERREKVAERNGWGKQRAEDEERHEKERVSSKWREYWADELNRQRRNGRRGAGGDRGGQKRSKRQQVEANQSDRAGRDRSKEAGRMEMDDEEAQEAEADAEVQVDEPAAKRQRSRSSSGNSPARRNSGRLTQKKAGRLIEASMREEQDVERDEEPHVSQPAPAASVTTDGNTDRTTPVPSPPPPQPPGTTGPPTPSLHLPPSSPPRQQPATASNVVTHTDNGNLLHPRRLRSPPPTASPPSPPPRRMAHSPPLAVTVPSSHATLAAPRQTASVVASDDDTIPASSQQDDDDLALTPVATTVSSSISFDRLTSESDGEAEAQGESGNGRRRVRFNEHPVRIQLKVWEEDDEKEGKEAVDEVEQLVQEQSEADGSDLSQDESIISQPARRHLLPRKAREFLDRISGKTVSQQADEDERGSEHKHKEKLEEPTKQRPGNDGLQQTAVQQQSEQKETSATTTSDEQTSGLPQAEAESEISSRRDQSQTTDQQAISVGSAVSSASASAIPAQQAHDAEDEDDQSIAQLVKKPSTLPSPEQQLASLAMSDPPTTEPLPHTTSLDDTEDDEPSEEGQFTVEAILDKRRRRGLTEYLIHWKGYDTESDTWEPKDNLSCNELLAAFEATLSKQSGKQRAKLRKSKESTAEARDVQPADKTDSARKGSDVVEGEAETLKDDNGTTSSVVVLEDESEMKVDEQDENETEAERREAAVRADERKRTLLELKRRRISMDEPKKNGVRSDSDGRTTDGRRLSAKKRLASSERTPIEAHIAAKSVADCTLEELEYIARVKARDERKLAIRQHSEQRKREMAAATHASSMARPVRSPLGAAAAEGSDRTASTYKPGLLKRTSGPAVGGARVGERNERMATAGKETSGVSKPSGASSRIPKLSRSIALSNGTFSPKRASGTSSGYNSPPLRSLLRSSPTSPLLSPQLAPSPTHLSTPVTLSTMPSDQLVAQLGEINDALAIAPATVRSTSLPLSTPTEFSSIYSPPSPAARSISASDTQPPPAAPSENVLLMGDAALAFSLVLLDHRPTNPTTIVSALHPPSLTCPSTPFLSLLSCHPKLYCVPATGELSNLLPLSLTCGHLKGKRLYLRQDVDPLQLSDSFHGVRFGCVQLSLGSEGEDTASEVQLMAQLMCSVAQVMSSEGVLRWTVTAQRSAEPKRAEDGMRQRAAAAGLQLVSMERTYLGALQPSTATEDADPAVAADSREKVRAELTAYMGGETYVFTRLLPPPQPVPSVVVDAAKMTEERRSEIFDRLRRERAEEKERERQQRDQRAREKYAVLAKQPPTEGAVSSHSYHRVQLSNHVPRFDADKARFSAQAFLQHRIGPHGSPHLGSQSYGSAFVR